MKKNKLISAFDIYDENLLLQIKSYIIEVQETLVHTPKLWAENISKRALIIVSINKR